MDQQKPNGSNTRRSFFATMVAAIGGGSVLGTVLPGLFRRTPAAAQNESKAPVVTVHPQAVSRTNKGVKHG